MNKISPVGMDIFEKSKYLCGSEMTNPDGIMVRSASLHEIEFPNSLKAIARAGAGINNIPIDKCSQAGIVVFNTPGANANAVKELTIFGILLSARRIYPAMTWVQTLVDKGEEIPQMVEKGKGDFAGPEIMGKKLGVIGLGAIGVMVANAACQLGMEVYGYDPYLSVDAAWNISQGIYHAATIKEVYGNCDFITIHVPFNNDTKHMINSESISIMKHGVRIINFSRGELVVDEDILIALNKQQVQCYITDFPNAQLLGHSGVLAIPHLGASTPESEDNCAKMAAQQLVEYLENGNIHNSVNFPDVTMPRIAGTRVTILHKNVPAMISGITNTFSQAKMNIENLTNKSKNEMAYTMVDINDMVTEGLITQISTLENVVKVNVYR